jgi:hypothetical protein
MPATCTGTCTWQFNGTMWVVVSSSCSSGCVCADALTLGGGNPKSSYYDTSNPAISNASLANVTGNPPASGQVCEVAHRVMYRRLEFLVGLKSSSLSLWNGLDTDQPSWRGNATATGLVNAAWNVVKQYNPATGALPPKGPPFSPLKNQVILPCTG